MVLCYTQTIFFDFLYQITFFVVLIVIDERPRQGETSRLFVCLTVANHASDGDDGEE